MAKSKSADYGGTFARVLRGLLEEHPNGGGKTTYGKLGAVLGVKPQSISQWANGDTTPDMKHIVPLADFFGVDCNYLLTGISAENKTVWEDLGLHENSVRFLKDLKRLADEKELNATAMILITDLFFRSGALTQFMEMINQYVYDRLENEEILKRDQEEADRLATEGASNADVLRAINRMRSHEHNNEFIWFKSALKASGIMQLIIERGGGLKNFEDAVFQGQGRTEAVPEGFEDLASGTLIGTGEVYFAEDNRSESGSV